MTILPDERYFSRWQRAKSRAQAFIEDFKNWCREGNAYLPNGWNPDWLERHYAEAPREMEKVIEDHKAKS